MLRGRSNSLRGARGTSANSRGAPSSRGRGRGASGSSSTSPTTNPPNPFDQERSENAAKREQKGQQNGILNGRGSRGAGRGRYTNKSVRFASPLEDESKQGSATETPVPMAADSTPSMFGTPTNVGPAAKTSFNPFAAAANPFGNPKGVTTPGLFRSSQQVKVPALNPFATQTPSRTAQESVFGVPSGSGSAINPFRPETKAISKPPIKPAHTNAKSGASTSTLNHASQNPRGVTAPFERQPPKSSLYSGIIAPSLAVNRSEPTKNKLGVEIADILRKNGIVAPFWPTSAPGDPREKGAMEAFWQTTKAYRANVRAYLMKNGLLDDPDKPKKLADAIDFKGTCEDMCPEFEKITRIVEHDVQNAEKELSPDGKTYWPSLNKMIKANARSAAGQDAPLPEDVRSPAALRRTLDYLIDEVLGTNDLPKVHGFLWDRTRAVRRDFVFQAASMTSHELLDQVYCLELIARFHVIALHQMSHGVVVAEDFSEQQEVEQLGKTLLSLIHAYEDCMVQGIRCDNESEFRAYYVLFNSQDTGILEAVQDWGWGFWGESDDIRTAVSLVETLQNTWDMHGPLIPSPIEIAQNTYHRYFSILYDTKVSYTMACFAEIHFNQVRKAAFKTILASYRKQRDQTRDWTLEKLNMYLHFDDELDVITFGEAYGLHFEEYDGHTCLSLSSDDSMSDPFPRLKQPHSYNLVERKRGKHTLLEVMHRTIYEESEEISGDNGLFVPLSPTATAPSQLSQAQYHISDILDPLDDPVVDEDPILDPTPMLFSMGRVDSLTSNAQLQRQATQFISLPLNKTQTSSIQDSASNSNPISSQKLPDMSKSGDSRSVSMFDMKSSAPKGSPFSFVNPNRSGSTSDPSSAASPLVSTTASDIPKGSSDLSSPVTAPSVPIFGASIGDTAFATTQPVPSLNPGKGLLEPTTGKADDSGSLEESAVKHVENKRGHDVQKAGISVNEARRLLDRPSGPPMLMANKQQSVKATPPASRMPALANWVAAGKGGLIDQFTEYTVEKILMQTVADYLADEKRSREQEEERVAHEDAAAFRYKSLATKYCHRWRQLAHRMWMKRKGRLAREARRKMAEESLRSSKTDERKDLVEEFRLSGGHSSRRSLDQLQSVTNSSSTIPIKRTTLYNIADTSSSSQSSPRLTNGESHKPSGHKRNQSSGLLRQSLLSKSAYLQGGSRIHLLPAYSPREENHRQLSGVKTDYFRLKARGIMTLPGGTPLANTAAVHLLHHKRSLDDLHTLSTPTRPSSRATPMSVPAKPVTRDAVPTPVEIEIDEDIETLKARARAVLKQDKEERQASRKRLLDNDDEELFAKAKRIREQMDEGAEWFRVETQR